MKLNSPAVEKAIRGLARKEIRSSPKLRREYERHRNVWLPALNAVRMAIALPIYLAMLGGLGAVVFGCLEGVLLGLQWNPTLGLAAIVLVLTALVLTSIALDHDRLFPGDSLRTAAHFPLPDRQLLIEALKKKTLDGFGVTVVFLVAFEFLVWFNHLPIWAYPLAIGLAVIQGMMFSALCVLMLGHLLQKGRLAGIMCFAGFFVIPAGLLGLSWPVHEGHIANGQYVAWATFVLLPPGWVVGAFYWGVLQGQPAGWLLLAPVALVLRAAVRWMRQGIAIREFDLNSQGNLPVVFDRGVRSATELPVATPAAETAQSHPQPQAQATKENCAEQIEQRIFEGDLLRGPGKWTQEGWIERLICRKLTPREQTVMEYLVGPPPAWTLQWGVFAIVLVVAGAIGFFLPEGDQEGPIDVPIIAAIVGCWGVSVFASILAKSANDLLPTWGVSCQPYFPIGFLEASWATAKVAVFRCVCSLPLTLSFTLVVGWYCGFPPWISVVLGLAPLGIYLAFLPLWICWLFRPMFVMPYIVFMMVVSPLVSIRFVLYSPWVMLAPMPALAWLGWGYCAWAHHRR